MAAACASSGCVLGCQHFAIFKMDTGIAFEM